VLLLVLLSIAIPLAALPLNVARADTVVGTVPVGSYPQFSAVDQSTNMVYVPNTNSGTVSVINGSDNVVVATIPVGPSPTGVAANPDTNLVYVGNQNQTSSASDTVSVIDSKTNAVVDTIQHAVNFGGLAVDPVTDTIYAVDGGALTVIDGATNQVAGSIALSFDQTYNIAVDPVTDMVYVTATNEGINPSGVLIAVDGKTGTQAGYVLYGMRGDGVAVDPTTNTILTTDDQALYVFNGTNDALMHTVPLSAYGAAVNPATGKVYITNDGDSLYVYSESTLSRLQVLTVGSGDDEMSVNSATDTVYVVNIGASSVSVVNGGSGLSSRVSVDSENTYGSTITGYRTVIYVANGTILAKGFTPNSFTVTVGQTYEARAESYGSCNFVRWSNGVTSDPQSFTATSSAVTFTAVYACGTSSVAVDSVDQNGNAITGYRTVLYSSDGTIVDKGFTPSTFTTDVGNTYGIRAESYGSCTFSHWSDGVTSDPRTFTTTSSPVAYTAVYDCSSV
jgi:YVTN family beta-propeller protein